MAYVNDDEYTKLRDDSNKFKDYAQRVSSAQLLVLAAAKCGFTDINQRDALIMALERLTGLDTCWVELLLDVKPRQMR